MSPRARLINDKYTDKYKYCRMINIKCCLFMVTKIILVPSKFHKQFDTYMK